MFYTIRVVVNCVQLTQKDTKREDILLLVCAFPNPLSKQHSEFPFITTHKEVTRLQKAPCGFPLADIASQQTTNTVENMASSALSALPPAFSHPMPGSPFAFCNMRGSCLFVFSVPPGSHGRLAPKENHTEISISYKADWPTSSGFLLTLMTYINPLF